jgi:hypothetical protein
MQWPRDGFDMVWSLMNDGQWHTRESIVRMLPLCRDDISESLDFLVKYGFAISGARRLRVPLDSPSPKDIFELLHCIRSLVSGSI